MNDFCQDKSQKIIFTFKINAVLISCAHHSTILGILPENLSRNFSRETLILPESHSALNDQVRGRGLI